MESSQCWVTGAQTCFLSPLDHTSEGSSASQSSASRRGPSVQTQESLECISNQSSMIGDGNLGFEPRSLMGSKPMGVFETRAAWSMCAPSPSNQTSEFPEFKQDSKEKCYIHSSRDLCELNKTWVASWVNVERKLIKVFQIKLLLFKLTATTVNCFSSRGKN